MKRLISTLLAALMLFSLVACGSSAPSDDTQEPSEPVVEEEEVKEEVDFYEVNGVRYPAALGAPVLGEAAAELAESAIFSEAAKQITTVGDAYYYLSTFSHFNQPYDVCKLFINLLTTDYDELGMIYLECLDNGYCVAYVKSGDIYYPFDPFSMAEAWTLDPKYNCISDTDLEALCERLMTAHPFNPNGAPMTSWKTEVIASNTLYSGAEKDAVIKMTTPHYSETQIKQWVADGLTLEEWAEKISTPADAIQLLRAIKYRENADTAPDDNHGFWDTSDVNWCGIWNAHLVFEHRNGNCGGTSTIFNYLLAGDFDEQGYVEFSSAAGGHIFNYFVLDGIYAVCDFVGIPGINFYSDDELYTPDTRDYFLYVGDDVYEFGEWYHKEGPFATNFENPDSEDYLYSLFMYPCEGSKMPKGCDGQSPPAKVNNSVVCDILPEQYKDRYTILYEREGYPIRFAPITDKSAWPAEIR